MDNIGRIAAGMAFVESCQGREVRFGSDFLSADDGIADDQISSYYNRRQRADAWQSKKYRKMHKIDYLYICVYIISVVLLQSKSGSGDQFDQQRISWSGIFSGFFDCFGGAFGAKKDVIEKNVTKY